jgi:hypothetical protein
MSATAIAKLNEATVEVESSLLDQIIQSEPRFEIPVQVRQPSYTVRMLGQHAHAKLAAKNVCGNDSRDGTFRYDLKVTTTGVNEQGFSIDSRFPDTIYSRWSNDVFVASCEQLAGGIIAAVLEAYPEVTSVQCTIYNRVGSVEVDWVVGQEMPIAPRKATCKEVADGLQYKDNYRC